MSKHSKVNLWGTHTSTVLSITLVLTMLGMLMMLEYHSYRQTHDLQEQTTFRIDLQTYVDEQVALGLKRTIEGMPCVKHVDYISSDEAAKIFTEDLGDDFIDFLGYNPLSPSLMVNLRADILPDNQSDVLNQFKHDVMQLQGVSAVEYQEKVVTELNDIYYKLSWFLIFFIGLLLLLSVVLISSTIRIALYAQRDTIRTMRMVGAKVSFIARPFIRRGFFYGLLGGLFASLLSVGFMWLFNNRLQLGINFAVHYLWYVGIALVLVLVGMLISYLSTLFTVRRYVRHIDYEN